MVESVVKEFDPKIVRQSVRELDKDNIYGDAHAMQSSFGLVNYDLKFIARWGVGRRQAQLRQMAYDQFNTLPMGAIMGLMNRLSQTPYELSGGPRLTRHWDNLLRNAEFGAGWTALTKKVLFDYFTLDHGAFIEIIGPGNPDKALRGSPTGIAHLDSLRCYVTGDPEFPVYYASHISGKMHKLHGTRVIRLVDNPSPDPQYRNLGFCALSRMLAVTRLHSLMNQHDIEKLDNLPPRGILSLSNVNPKQWNEAETLYQADKLAQGQTMFDGLMKVFGLSSEYPVKTEITAFSTLPEQFNYDTAIKTQVNLVALALGEDPQEIWPLSGSGLGNGQQSTVLHSKGKGKTYGAVLQELTRVINTAVLPESLEFKFKPKDTEQDREEAETARSWSFMIRGLVTDMIFSREQALEVLARTVPVYSDIILDESGNVRLPDSDELDEDQPHVPKPIVDEIIIPDDTPPNADTKVKTLQSERIDFEDSFTDALTAFQSGRMDGRRFGVVSRALIARHGRSVFDEGMKDGGVDPGDKTNVERQLLSRLIREQSQYVSSLIRNINQENLQNQPNRASMWWNKSLMPFYMAALESAAKNAAFEWVYGDTDHCDDCQRLNGQVHRFRDWQSNGWLPQSDKLECKGFNCKCRLVKTDKRATGRF